jgi:hypothetical protein
VSSESGLSDVVSREEPASWLDCEKRVKPLSTLAPALRCGGRRQLQRDARACLGDVVDRVAGGLVAVAHRQRRIEVVVDVAVQHEGLEPAMERVGLEQQRGREAVAGRGAQEGEAVGLVVGP